MPEGLLMGLLGPASGRHLHALAHGRDPRPVKHRARRRSMGAQRALGRRPRPPEEIASTLLALVDRVSRRLRGAERECRTVVLRLRFADYTRATRSSTLPAPTADTGQLAVQATRLLQAATPEIRRRGLTLVGISLTGLTDARTVQLALPIERRAGLDQALDRVRERFGADAIVRGAGVGRDPGQEMPLLPD